MKKFEFPRQEFVIEAGRHGAGPFMVFIMYSKTAAVREAKKLRKDYKHVAISSMGVTFWL